MPHQSPAPVISPENASRITWHKWIARYPYTAAAVVLFISQAFPPMLRHHNEWTEVYVAASQDLLAGRNFLAEAHGYSYPPFLTMVSLPFTLMPPALSVLIFYAISVACFVYVVKSAWSLSGGGRLQGAGERAPSGEHLLFLLALFCAGRFLLDALNHMQTDLLIAALLMAGCLALHANRGFRAATWIGLAAAMKCTPLLFAPYLAWRGKWVAALWLITISVGVNFLPDLVHRPPSGGFWAMEWYTRYIQPMGQQNYVPGNWSTAIDNNQSLAGAVNRLFTTSLKWTAAGAETVNSKSALSPLALKGVTFLVYALVTIPSVYAMWRRRRRGTPVRDKPDADSLEFSIVFLLMLLLSPISSRAHFGVMLLPALCVGRIAISEGNRAALTLLLLATLASLISYSNPLNILHPVALWAGFVSLVAVLLLAGCILGLLQKKSALQEGAQSGPNSSFR